MSAARDSIRARWEALSPSVKQKVVAGGAVAALAVIVIAGVSQTNQAGYGQGTQRQPQKAESILLRSDPREIGVRSLAAEVRGLSTTVSDLQADNERLRRAAERPQPAATASSDGDAKARAEIQELRAVIASLQAGKPVDGVSAVPASPRPPVPPGQPGQSVQQGQGPGARGAVQQPTVPPPPPRGIVTIESPAPAKADPSKADAKAKPRPKTYIPSGSIMSGVILTGVDAPTGRSASSNPLPVLIRVQHEAILPSRYRADVREAFVLAEAFGDLSSERVYIRAQQFSMVLRDGTVVDRPIRASAVGSDGSAGLRGKLVSKQGQMIANALFAGFADGAARAFGGNNGGYYGGGFNPGDAAQSGFSTGASTALDRVASYFLQQADAMHPVIEMAPGRGVSLIVLSGFDLDLASK